MIWLIAIVIEVAILLSVSAGIFHRRKSLFQDAEDTGEPVLFPILFSCLVCIGSVFGGAWNILYLVAAIVDNRVSIESIAILSTALGLVGRPAQFQFYVSLGGQEVDLNATTSAVMQTVPLCLSLVLKSFDSVAMLGILVAALILILGTAGVLILWTQKRLPWLVIAVLALFQVFAIAVKVLGDGSKRALIAQRLLPFCSAWLALLCSLHVAPDAQNWTSLLWTSFLMPAVLSSFGAIVAGMARPRWHSLLEVYVEYVFNGCAGVVGVFYVLRQPLGPLLGIPVAGFSLADDPYLRSFVQVWRHIGRVLAKVPLIGDFVAGVAEAALE